MDMLKRLLVLFVVLIPLACAKVDMGALANIAKIIPAGQGEAFTNAEAVGALKEALSVGVNTSCNGLSRTDGYMGDALVKIMLPPEAQPIVNSVSAIPGGQKLLDDVVLRLNRSAEKSAKEAAPIFIKAIDNMTVSDGISIVRGGETAATEYLEEKTHDELVDLFKPELSKTLSEPLVAGVSANSAWQTLVSAYNKAGTAPNAAARLMGKTEPMPKVSADLAQYASEKSVDAVFLKVADEEKDIRAEPMKYTSSLIKKVFGAVAK